MSCPLRLLLVAALVAATIASCPTTEWHRFGDMCYWRSSTSSHWVDVQDECESQYSGSEMVSIHDLELDAFIAEELLDGVQAWLGLRRVSDSAPWNWTDGSPFDYRHWYNGSPDWYGEGCATINYIKTGDWTGWDCYGDSFPFVCQSPAF